MQFFFLYGPNADRGSIVGGNGVARQASGDRAKSTNAAQRFPGARKEDTLNFIPSLSSQEHVGKCFVVGRYPRVDRDAHIMTRTQKTSSGSCELGAPAAGIQSARNTSITRVAERVRI